MPNIIEEILKRPKPRDIAAWWQEQKPEDYSDILAPEEEAYLDYFTSDEVKPVLRVGKGIANLGNLTPEDRERAKTFFGAGPEALPKFVNWENRRRIIAHYFIIHPATITLELQLYRTTRDMNPVLFIGERINQIITGKEAMTNEDVSRIGAAVELIFVVIVGRILRAARPGGPSLPPSRSLTDPIYDLPPEGGGVNINGRWYTEHALERMAPDTPQIRAELVSRAAGRLKRIGIDEGSEAWGKCMAKALSKIDPRGVPPSVVEAEILRPGSTNVRVITAKKGTIVITVIPH